MRLGLIVAAALASPLALADPAPPPASPGHYRLQATIHLDNDRLDAIRQSDPARYDKIAEVLRVAQLEPCHMAPQILKTKLDVDAKCQGSLVYTSYPAKTVLHFTLEGTEYETFVVQNKLSEGGLMPLK